MRLAWGLTLKSLAFASIFLAWFTLVSFWLCGNLNVFASGTEIMDLAFLTYGLSTIPVQM